MCCGQKRSALRNSRTKTTPRSIQVNVGAEIKPPSTPPQRPAGRAPARGTRPPISYTIPNPKSTTNIRYRGISGIRVRGAISGLYYEFSGVNQVQRVDPRDAPSLLSTRYFRRG